MQEEQSPVSTIGMTINPMMSPTLRTVIGKDSSEPFPMLDRVWDIFSQKGIRTVFLTIGASISVAADLEIAEGLGCPLNVVTLNQDEQNKWAEIATIIKERKRDEKTASTFSQGAESKWILPKNLRVQSVLPWWTNGTIDLSNNTPIKTQFVGESMTSICSTMKIKDNITRIDVLKVDTRSSAPGLEKGILSAVLNAGFRPAVILVHWDQRPDVELSTTIAAGHLQNAGYRLMSVIDNKFLYYFTDNDMYQVCSWEDTTCNNPLVNELVKSVNYM